VHLNWIFFRKWAQYHSLLMEILTPATGKQFAAVIHGDNLIILKKFLEFSIFIWKQHKNEVIARLCKAVMGYVGRVTCVYKAWRTTFNDNETLIQLLDEYVRTVVDLQATGAQEFVATFGKHMGGEPIKGWHSVKNRLSILIEPSSPSGL
jgi:hypothetical protein